jgi:hypothetical protein
VESLRKVHGTSDVTVSVIVTPSVATNAIWLVTSSASLELADMR